MRTNQDLRERLRSEREKLRARIAEIDREAALLTTPADDMRVFVPASMVISRLRRRLAGRQTREMVMEVLSAAYPEELRARDIRREVLTRFGEDINPNTLTSILGRCRGIGVVQLARRAWIFVPGSFRKDSTVEQAQSCSE